MSVSRRGFLAGILAAGVAPLYVPNLKVWVPTPPTPEELVEKVRDLAYSIDQENRARMVRMPAMGTYHFDEWGLVLVPPKEKFVWVKAQPLVSQPMVTPGDLVFFQGPRPWLK